MSSDGLSHSESEDEEEEEDAASDDSDDAGDLRRPGAGIATSRDRAYQTPEERKAARRAEYHRPRPRMVAGDGDDAISATSSRANATLGQRKRAGQDRASRTARDDVGRSADASVLGMRKMRDGGMEMSFMPSSGGRKGDDIAAPDYVAPSSLQKRQKESAAGGKVERFGAGLEKGGYRALAGGEREVSLEERQGRQKRRQPGRSASKNTFRSM